MKKLVIRLEPFVYEQQLFLFEDNSLTLSAKVPMKDIATRAMQFVVQDDVREIDISGIHEYATTTKREIQKEELITYSENKIKINLI